MVRRNSGFVAYFSFLLFSIVLGAASARATVHIFEVHPQPPDNPTQLVIYGTDFGETRSSTLAPR